MCRVPVTLVTIIGSRLVPLVRAGRRPPAAPIIAIALNPIARSLHDFFMFVSSTLLVDPHDADVGQGAALAAERGVDVQRI